MTEEVKAPTLEQIEGARNALVTFCMYHYQALRQEGYSVEDAKRKVADEIILLYDKYAQNARITFKPERMRNPQTLLDEVIEDAKGLGMQGKALYHKLLDFKRLIDVKGEGK